MEPTDKAINGIFLPVHFGQTEPLPDELQGGCNSQGGLGIPDLKAEAQQLAPHLQQFIIQGIIPTNFYSAKFLEEQLKLYTNW